jgi:two-component system chemotaxis response regulator CheY
MPGTLLITDDAMIIREMIKEVAGAAGWQVVGEAHDGQRAVELFEELRPDVCTIDIVMPGFDGLHAVRGIRELDPEARIVMVSAVDTKQALAEAFRLGASDFIVKPFQRDSLVATLEKQLEA